MNLEMNLEIDQDELCRELATRLASERFRTGIANLAADPFFVAYFLTSVSQGEGLGEAAVGMIGHEELARFIHDLKRQELEERGHKEQTLEAARELFPELFVEGRYRYEGALSGRPYYLAVLQANRERLRRTGRYSRLNLYLTTTFGYEVMVVLLYRTVADAIARGPLPDAIRQRVTAVLESVLAEEETHLGILDQHRALLGAPRGELSAEACALLDTLEKLEAGDYEFAADLAVEQVARMMERYEQPARHRAQIEANAPPA